MNESAHVPCHDSSTVTESERRLKMYLAEYLEASMS